jgi:signal transduction histidine kinase/CheY-like chemotaxis protein
MSQAIQSENELSGYRVPPFWASFLLCVVIVLAFGWLRLVVFQDRLIPLAYGLPLLLCLWNRDLRLLYGMSIAFSAMAVYKAFWLASSEDLGYDVMAVGMQLAGIWIVAGVIHGLLQARERIEQKTVELEQTNAELDASNEELAASNEELAAREEEIVRQNEELQSQAEELEQQSEELRQQSEELRQQSEEMELQRDELQEINTEMSRREKAMETLLESSRWLRGDLTEPAVMSSICQAAVQVMGDSVQAAAVVQELDGALSMRGHWGFGLTGAVREELPFDRSFAALVLERGQTAYIEDVTTRPDVQLPHPSAGRPFQSVLATPVWVEGKAVATVEVFSQSPQEWTIEQFRVIEWLGVQAAMALQAMRFQQELELKRRDAEEASIQKTRFLAAVSHDVRTPANAIGLLSELMEQAANDPNRVQEVAELARDLKNNASLMIDLVSDVLDLARFDIGRLDVQITEFPMSSLIQAELKQSAPLAESRGLRLSAAMPEHEIWLRTDRIKLARVLSNLVGNALKFTEQGEVEVRCQVSEEGLVILRVSDTGMGISQEHLPYIFDEFFQLRNPERDSSKGTGLGLAICKRLVEGLGCSISVSSSVGAGTVFNVHIPSELVAAMDPVRPGGARASADGEAGASLGGLHVLLVEDHDVTRRTTAKLLAGAGAIVTQARTGREALYLLDKGEHQVLLLDLMLPDIDGSEVLRSLQANRPAALRCALVVSGDVRPYRVQQVKALGADDLLAKPLAMSDLLRSLRGLCGPQQRASTEPVSAVRSAATADAQTDAG